MARHTTATFIAAAQKIHGDRFDYSKVVYEFSREKVTIICPIHGEFMMTPNKHLRGQRCRACGLADHGASRVIPFEDFLRRARSIHGDKYQYSGYSRMTAKITITCPHHGDFLQSPDLHVLGQGCTKCGHEKISSERTYDTETFIEKVRAVHGDLYDYSMTEYHRAFSPVTIICRTHGPFDQRAHNHLNGMGCPSCAKNGFQMTMPGELYVLHSNCERFMKVGITRDFPQRMYRLRHETPFAFTIYSRHSGEGFQVKSAETMIHKQLTSAGFSDFAGATEWFIREDIVRLIEEFGLVPETLTC